MGIMCGRFAFRSTRKKVTEVLPLFEVPELQPRYNIAPTQPVAVARIVPESLRKEVTFLNWGLLPGWVDDPKVGQRMINARAETVATKPSFRAAFKRRRCLILADGFYEWQKVGNKKQPYFIHLKNNELFTFAGLWEHWERNGNVVESCAIITTEANELIQSLHIRMPVILPSSVHERWLDPQNQTGSGLASLLVPYPKEEMAYFPVDTHVNNARNEDAGCIQPLLV